MGRRSSDRTNACRADGVWLVLLLRQCPDNAKVPWPVLRCAGGAGGGGFFSTLGMTLGDAETTLPTTKSPSL